MEVSDLQENYSFGWIKVFRSLMNHPLLWEKRKFSKFEAWIFMLFKANHSTKKIINGRQIIVCERGSFITSELKLSGIFLWDRSAVRAFLKLLKTDLMIEQQTNTKYTKIIICKYDTYQSLKPTNGTASGTTDSTSDEQQMNTTKEVKNYKKKEKGAFTPPTVEEVIEYFIENGYADWAAKKAHEHYRLANWHDTNNKPVKNWKQKMHTVWFKDEHKTKVKLVITPESRPPKPGAENYWVWDDKKQIWFADHNKFFGT